MARSYKTRGRKKRHNVLAEVQELARQETVEAVEALVEIMVQRKGAVGRSRGGCYCDT
jgi:hypothetical protein